MVEFVTACRICALIAGLLVTAHFVNHQADWESIKAVFNLIFNPVRRWWALLNWEAKKTIGIVLTVMLLLVGRMFS